jgi:hypothetical protein
LFVVDSRIAVFLERLALRIRNIFLDRRHPNWIWAPYSGAEDGADEPMFPQFGTRDVCVPVGAGSSAMLSSTCDVLTALHE